MNTYEIEKQLKMLVKSEEDIVRQLQQLNLNISLLINNK